MSSARSFPVSSSKVERKSANQGSNLSKLNNKLENNKTLSKKRKTLSPSSAKHEIRKESLASTPLDRKLIANRWNKKNDKDEMILIKDLSNPKANIEITRESVINENDDVDSEGYKFSDDSEDDEDDKNEEKNQKKLKTNENNEIEGDSKRRKSEKKEVNNNDQMELSDNEEDDDQEEDDEIELENNEMTIDEDDNNGSNNANNNGLGGNEKNSINNNGNAGASRRGTDSSISDPNQKFENLKGKSFKGKLIVVLIRAQLETVKTRKGYELVSADTHGTILKKLKKNPADFRPDICHQALLTLLDSPLNKAGRLQIYVQTEKNVLIEVSPHLRIPRTFKRFAGLMVQLLHKLKIRAANGPDILLKVIKNPVTQYLPVGVQKIGTSVQGELVDMMKFVPNTFPNTDEPCVLVVGSHANGPASVDWTEKTIAVSQYPLSAAYALGRMLHAFEARWNIL